MNLILAVYKTIFFITTIHNNDWMILWSAVAASILLSRYVPEDKS